MLIFVATMLVTVSTLAQTLNVRGNGDRRKQGGGNRCVRISQGKQHRHKDGHLRTVLA